MSKRPPPRLSVDIDPDSREGLALQRMAESGEPLDALVLCNLALGHFAIMGINDDGSLLFVITEKGSKHVERMCKVLS